MDAWLAAYQPWTKGPAGYLVLLIVAFVPMIFVALRRRLGFDTYWPMPLHVLGVVVIVAALRLAGPLVGLCERWPGVASIRW